VAITSVFWNWLEGYDLHVVQGQKARTLNDLLVIKDVDPATQAEVFKNASEDGGHPFGTTTRFFAECEGGQSPGSGHTLKSFDATTGQVEAASPLPATRLFNFLVRAEVTLPASGSPPTTTVFSMKPRIRVHVHGSVTRAWLTPDPLSIPQGADGQRFSVLAEFDDQVVGDISRLPNIQWSVADAAANTNTDGSTKIGADPATGAITVAADHGDVPVKATLPPGYGGLAPTGVVRTLAPWSTPRAAVWIDGPGPAFIKSVANYLFLADGFGPGEKDEFARRVRAIVRSMRWDTRLSPYYLLGQSLNYWMVWIESRQRGVSVMPEVNLRPNGARTSWVETPVGVAPPPPPAPPQTPPFWRGDEMFFEIGLPVPGDVIPPGTASADIDTRFDAQKKRWKALYGNHVDGRVDRPGFVNWCSWGDRRLADEQDTALGLAMGKRPNHENPSGGNSIDWHSFRTKRIHIDAMLANLTHPGPADSPWTGKDKDYVCVLVGGTKYAAQAGEVVKVSLIPQGDVLLRPATGRAMAIDPYPLPNDPLPQFVAWTVAHEMGHNLRLGDEYAAPGTFNGTLAPTPNLQDRDSLTIANPSGDRLLVGSKIKWLYHRIAKVGILAGPPTDLGSGKFRIPLKPGQAAPFKAGETVFLRARPLDPVVGPSPELTVTLVDAGLARVTVQSPGGAPAPTAFTADAVLYAPVRASAGGAPLTLVAESIQAHITSTGRPLNASKVPWFCDALKPYSGYQGGHNVPTTIVLKPGIHRGWIVGAYEGGAARQCGVYHPAGACMMSENRGDQTSGTEFVDPTDSRIDYWLRDKAYPFCPVCRYLIVDTIDPLRHMALDDEYVKSGRYPG
jgi:hypothetical protein